MTARHHGDDGIQPRQRNFQVCQQSAGLGVHPALLQKSQAARKPLRASQLATGKEVLSRRQIVEQRQILIDGLDAGEARIRRGAYLRWRTVQKDRAGIELVHPADAFGQRRFTRAIVAEQADDLAAPHLDADIVEGQNRTETLGSSAYRQHGIVRRDRVIGVIRSGAHDCLPACRTRTRPSR